uniref:Tail fiber protein n=1 Tax=Podoviridae sp. ctU557 TaxID=2827736 RepID=A0A8S5T934_9CAUD|nr:MAG TPA: tail fiber protein [Podoviridae sp. ctU557]
MAYKKDLATGLIGRAIDTKATSLVLQSGYGASMPKVPFYLTLTPATQLSTQGNSEIVLVTGRTSDTLTITRAQKNTTAKSFAVGDIVAAGSYADDENGVYSTSEIDTGRVWIDGRPIYRKVVRGTVNMVGGYNTSSLPHGIQGLTSRWELIKYYGNMRLGGTLSNNLVKQALPYIEGTHQSGVTSIDQTNITISGSYPWGSSEVSLVLEYVK